MATVMVLKDGETYSAAAGCQLVFIDDKVLAELEHGDVRADDFEEHGYTLIEFEGNEAIAFTDDERALLAEAVLYMEEHGHGEPPIYKDELGRTVSKKKRERAFNGVGEKLRLS